MKSGRRVQSQVGMETGLVEVLRLLTAGRYNPEMIEELFINVNAIARHLQNPFCEPRQGDG